MISSALRGIGVVEESSPVSIHFPSLRIPDSKTTRRKKPARRGGLLSPDALLRVVVQDSILAEW